MNTRLNSLEKNLYTVNREVCDAQWDLYTTGDSERWPAAMASRADLYGNPEVLTELKAFRPENPQEKWRIERLVHEFIRESVRVDSEITSLVDQATAAISSQRTQLNGKPATADQIDTILRREPDRQQRKQAWWARASMGSHHTHAVLALCKQRNQAARGLGYSTFHDLVLETQWLNRNTLDDLARRLKAATDPLWESFLSTQATLLGVSDLQLWDLQIDTKTTRTDAFSAERIIPMAERAMVSMGIPLSETHITLDTEARDNKSEHAYCFPVDPPNDIRILANVCDGIHSLQTLLHEIGHALHAAHIKPSTYTFRDAPNHAFSEAIAELIASVVWQPEFLSETTALDTQQIQIQIRKCATKQLSQVRWLLVWHELEHQLFHNPECDAHGLFWQLVESHLGVVADAKTRELAPWGNVVHFVTHPVYLQNYIWAQVMSAQLSQAVINRFGSLLSHQAGLYIKEMLFSPGASVDSNTLLHRVTGNETNVAPLIEFLSQSTLAR